MMKRTELKGFIKGIIFSALVCTLAMSAFAATRTIQVTDGINMMLDGVKFTPTDVNGKVVEVFAYNDTTYVPIRAVSQAFGKAVDWNGATNTVIIGKPGDGKPPEPTNTYNLANPAPIGTSQRLTMTGYESYTVDIALTEAVRGDKAWEMIKKASPENYPPPTGKEYLVAKVKATFSAIGGEGKLAMDPYRLKCFSAGNSQYVSVFVIEPVPVFRGTVTNGESLEGYVVYAVNPADKGPKIGYGANLDGTSGAWFKTN